MVWQAAGVHSRAASCLLIDRLYEGCCREFPLVLPVGGAEPPAPAGPGRGRRAGRGLARAQAAPRAPVLVLNSLDGTVSVIDGNTWVERRRIATGREPHHLYMTPDEKSVIVANAGSDSLTFIDPRTAEVQRSFPASSTRTTCAFRPT
jgi:YVTN family beta-propeller protein